MRAEGDAAASDPRQGAPLLDVLFLDENSGFAVGAYSQLLVTRAMAAPRGPASTSRARPPPRPMPARRRVIRAPSRAKSSSPSARKPIPFQRHRPHRRRLAVHRRRTRRGLPLRDQGATWQHLKWPLQRVDVRRHRLRGRQGAGLRPARTRHESADLGDHWTEVATGTELSLLGGYAWPMAVPRWSAPTAWCCCDAQRQSPSAPAWQSPPGALASALVAGAAVPSPSSARTA